MTNHPKFTEYHDSAARKSSSRTSTGSRKEQQERKYLEDYQRWVTLIMGKKTPKQMFGYFDSPQQTEPALQADIDAPCPLCWAMLDRADMKTISMMPISDAAGDHTPDGVRLDYIQVKGDKCYFYRVHKSCYEKAGEQKKTEAEDYIWTLIEGKMA